METPPIAIARRVAGAIRAHAVEVYPHECCGALFGAGRDVRVPFALPNTTDEGPRRRFRVSTTDYRLSESRASELGLELLGFYHSHPDAPARPSQYDLDHAWPSFLYLIQSVEQGQPARLTGWYLGDRRSSFIEHPIVEADGFDASGREIEVGGQTLGSRRG